MRTLKKTLALVLVIAMVASFGVISASADFEDVAPTDDYAEAIDVLNTLGVIDGVTDTTYNPEGTLTREQAATIIARLKLGGNSAIVAAADSAPFEDVPADRWSAGYVAYCANLGIIEGVGDNKFNPEGLLTSAAFTKMLLCALGYSAESEGLNGGNWAINTASLAQSIGLYDNAIGVSSVAPISRAEAAQLGLLALCTKTVKYVGGTSINVGGTTFTAGGSLVVNDQTLGEIVFNMVAIEDQQDDFGVPGTLYTIKGNPVYFGAQAASLHYDGSVKGKAIYSDLGLSKSVLGLELYVDGVETADFATANVAANSNTVFGGNGATVDVYQTGTRAYRIVVVNTYVDTVSSVKTTKDDATNVSTTTLYLKGGLKTTDFVDFAKKDVVIYTKAGSTIMSMEEAELISGTLTKIANGTKFTIGGEVYTVGAMAQFKAEDITSAYLGSTVAFYAAGSNLMKIYEATASVSKDYIKVLAAAKPSTSATWMNPTGDYTGSVYGILSDGSYGTYTVNYTDSELNTDNAITANTIWNFDLNSNGELVLTDATNVNVTETSFNSGATRVDGIIMNSATTYIYYTQVSKTDATIKTLSVRTGNANSGVVAKGAQIVFDKNNVALCVYVGGEYSTGTEVADLAMIVQAAGYSYEYGVGTIYNYVAFTADGEQLMLSAGEALTVGAVYAYNTDNTVASLKATVDCTIKVHGSVIELITETGSAYYNYDADMVCFLGDDTALADGQTVSAVIGSNGSITHLWVVEDAPVEE